MTEHRPPLTPEQQDRRRRRLEALDALREARQLRARLRPQRQQLERARALLHARMTRG